MIELLAKSVNQLADDEWKQVQQLKNKEKNPSVSFSRATLEDCARPDGLSLNIDYATVNVSTLRISASFENSVPSDFLCETWTLPFWW